MVIPPFRRPEKITTKPSQAKTSSRVRRRDRWAVSYRDAATASGAAALEVTWIVTGACTELTVFPGVEPAGRKASLAEETRSESEDNIEVATFKPEALDCSNCMDSRKREKSELEN